MVTFLTHGDAAAGVRRGSLSGKSECRESDGRAELQNTTET
jgi:hypothetical protein